MDKCLPSANSPSIIRFYQADATMMYALYQVCSISLSQLEGIHFDPSCAQ